MFTPNLKGWMQSSTGYDVNAEKIYGAQRECPYATVSMKIDLQKTSVRADSSASRGAADEIATTRTKILVPTYVTASFGDRFVSVEGYRFLVQSVHPRYSVGGRLDHYEIDLEIVQ
ncbi:hypothetical protein FHV99_004676 [Ochrobactrum sp. P20RRXII]|nr:hypothetical protein [Ochrobactrum sp. P20RRXII]NIH77424.1 hypothetical protein [Ochrobactrum sp. P20RRXII]